MRKVLLLLWLIFLIFPLGLLLPATEALAADRYGDVNGDSVVDLQDAILSLQVMSSITPSCPVSAEADIDGDQKIGMAEAIFILRNIAAIPTTTTLERSSTSISYKDDITLTATVSPLYATGTVAFYDGSTALGTGTLSYGTATLTTSALGIGTRTLKARYLGSSEYAFSTSAEVTVSVNQAPTTTGIDVSSTSVASGEDFTLTAIVLPSDATGQVTFYDGSTSLGTGTLNSGTASLTESLSDAGAHAISARYEGSDEYASSTSGEVTVTVAATSSTIALTASPDSIVYGENVTLEAVVFPSDAKGDVYFYDGSALLGTATLISGAATLSTSTLGEGTHTLKATYGGSTAYSSSTSNSVNVTVSKASTTTMIEASPTSVNPGESVTLTATVSPSAATGTVTFYDGSTSLGTSTLSSGTAILNTNTLGEGTHTLKATYGGSTAYSSSTSSSLTVTVSKASTTTTLNVSSASFVYGTSVTLTATVSPAAAEGEVTFYDEDISLGTGMLDSSGTAVLTTIFIGGGTRTLRAVYEESEAYATSTSDPVTVTVSAASSTTALAASPASVAYGESVTLTATVSSPAVTGIATGDVSFYEGSTFLGVRSLFVSGDSMLAVMSISSLSAGSHTIRAEYGGSPEYSASASTTVTVTITKTTTVTTLTASPTSVVPGSNVTLTAKVSPSAATGTVGGNVTFYDGTTSLGARTLSSGTATLITSTLAVGTHTLKAQYEGSAEYSTSESDTVNVTVASSSSGTTIALNGSSISVSGPGATASGSIVTIASAGTYTVSGTLSNGQILVDTADTGTVRLVLNGINITNTTTSPIHITQGKDTVIVLADNKNNYVTDGTSYVLPAGETEPDAAIFCRSDLTIEGNGSLTVTGKYEDGIAGQDGLTIAGGTISVNTETADDGIRGKDFIIVTGGTITIKSGGDGMRSTNDTDASKGYVSIQEGVFNITSGADAIQAETNVAITGGDFTLKSGGGNAGGTLAEDDSAKGIKANVGITIGGGTFNIDSLDDAIHCDDTVTINGGTFTLYTSSDEVNKGDGIHGDLNLVINGGEIKVMKGWEGIESDKITVNGGDIDIVAMDDGVSGGDGTGDDGFTNGDSYLYVNGGRIVVHADGNDSGGTGGMGTMPTYGDGIDINGTIYMTGGTVIVHGPSDGGDSAIDWDNSFYMNGGLLVAAGCSGFMSHTFSSQSTQNVLDITFDSSLSAGTLVRIQNSSAGILTFKPERAYQQVIFSSPQLQTGSEYEIRYGGSASGTAEDGLYGSGTTYTGGTSFETFTVDSRITEVPESSWPWPSW